MFIATNTERRMHLFVCYAEKIANFFVFTEFQVKQLGPFSKVMNILCKHIQILHFIFVSIPRAAIYPEVAFYD